MQAMALHSLWAQLAAAQLRGIFYRNAMPAMCCRQRLVNASARNKPQPKADLLCGARASAQYP